MLDNFLTIGQQVVIVFLIVLLGYIAGRTKLLSTQATDGMANLVVNYVTPAVIIMAFQRKFEIVLLQGFLVTMAAALACYFFSILFAHAVIHDEDTTRRCVMRCAAIFSNCGMIAMPLQAALFGNDGIFYGAAYVAAFNLVFWTYGTLEMGRGRQEVRLAKILLNPGLLGTVAGLALFFSSTMLPVIPANVCGYLSSMNVPLCMLVIGQRLSAVPIQSLFCEKGIWGPAAVRLVLVPIVMAVVMRVFQISDTVAVCAVIAAAAPAAASITLLAITCKQDADLAARVVSMQTILSLLTMPAVIMMAYRIIGG